VIADYFQKKELALSDPIRFLKEANRIASLHDDLPADAIVREVCRNFRTSSNSEKSGLKQRHTGDRSFLIFAHRMANMAMRKTDGSLLLDGITALLVENCGFDSRESVVSCAMLRFSADSLKMDFAAMANSVADKKNCGADEIVLHFASVSPNSIRLDDYGLHTWTADGIRQIGWVV